MKKSLLILSLLIFGVAGCSNQIIKSSVYVWNRETIEARTEKLCKELYKMNEIS